VASNESTMTTNFRDTEVAGLLRISAEVAEVGPELHVRRTHILNRLLALIGGCWAVCSEMDARHVNGSGWAVPNSITCAGKLSSYQQAVIDQYLTGQLAALDPCVPLLLRANRSVAAVRRSDVVDRSWFSSDHFNLVRRPIGFGESLYGILTTPAGRRLKLSLHREMKDQPFAERHVRLLNIFNENLAALYDAPREVRSPRDASTSPHARIESLPARLRPVLQRLLAGDAEKQAALKLGLSPHTVHEYTKVLYRTFAVNSRGELLAQFVGTPLC
jgi:DNA-binding CsgD family transcriptional regulator